MSFMEPMATATTKNNVPTLTANSRKPRMAASAKSPRKTNKGSALIVIG